MSKNIPILLAGHQAGKVTTLGFIMRVGPLPGGGYVRVTSMKKNFVYDDGEGFGAQTFYASTGAELSNLSSGEGLSVNNGEAKTLVEQFPGQGVTAAMVDNRELDGLEFCILKVNRRDGTMGHEWMASGPTGEVKMNKNGLITIELRSWSDLLRQHSIVERTSLTCRCRYFGSAPGDERFPCNYNLIAEWVDNVVVTSVGAETVREFTASALLQVADYFRPGLLEWTVGLNAGMSREIEAFGVGGIITLGYAARYAVQVGDEFNIRRDCTREWEGHNSCDTYGNREWFRGEPKTPVADIIALTVPGAANGAFNS